MEQAEAFKAYIEKYCVSQSELSRRTGIPQRTISARLALLSLTASMRARLEAGEIGPYEAIKIGKLSHEYQEPVAAAVSSGKIGGRMLEKICKLVQRESERKIDDIINEISEVKPKLIAQETSKTLGINPLPCAREAYAKLNSKQFNKTNEHIEEKCKKDNIVSDFDILLNIARDFGSTYRETCSELNKDGMCTCWIWDTKDAIPNGAGEPVKSGNIWRLKPSVLYCAFCANHVGDRMEEALEKLDVDPILRLRRYFKCQCGAKGKVAVFVKCTECLTEGWYGAWRPSNPV
jgi:transcriptional regulator with XRE-family HTH domain